MTIRTRLEEAAAFNAEWGREQLASMIEAAAKRRDQSRMTPLHIKIALHYHASPDQHPMLHNEKHREYAEDLVRAGLLRHECDRTTWPNLGYVATDGLAVWVEALCSTPFPVQRWVVPARDAGEG